MLTADEAYAKHIEMWKAMQEKLGDNPLKWDRERFKENWCEEHEDDVLFDCYLCQYAEEHFGCPSESCGDKCLVDWGTVYGDNYRLVGCVDGKTRYTSSPISEILALPRREAEREKD